MPQAVTSGTESETFYLKTLDGGFVTIRKMTYGEYLQRRQLVSSVKLSGNQNNSDFMGEIDLANQKVTEMEFAKCIVDHNLEDENGKQLDFKKPVNIHKLDPRIGEEIGQYIDQMNQYKDDDEELEGKSTTTSFPAQE